MEYSCMLFFMKVSAAKAWQSFPRQETVFQTSDSHCVQRILIPVLKTMVMCTVSLTKYFWAPENGGSLCNMSDNPEQQMSHFCETS